MQVVRLGQVAAQKWKAADRDARSAVFKKGQLKKARDLSRQHRGELVRILGPDEEVLGEVQEPIPR